MIDPLFYARLARAAYHQRPYDIDVGAYRAIVADSPLGSCLAIAGTDDIQTALTDVEAIVPYWSTDIRAMVPRSFWLTMLGALPEIRALAQYGRAPKVVAGHSLGAVLAIHTAARLCVAGAPPRAVMAFAPPRACIGDALAKLFAKCGVTVRSYRLGEDEVPMLPPAFNQAVPLIQLGRANSLLGDHDLDHIIAALGGTGAA